MQTKYRNRPSKSFEKEVKQGRKARAQTVNTKHFLGKQTFGAASGVRHIDTEEYLRTKNEAGS